MNLGEMKTALKRFGFDDNDPLLTWLNAAKDDVITYVPNWVFLNTEISKVLVAGQRTLTFIGSQVDSSTNVALDVEKIRSIRNVDYMTKLHRWTMAKFDREVSDPTQTGQVQVYVQTGAGIDLGAVAYNATKVQFYYVPTADTNLLLRLNLRVADLVAGNDSLSYSYLPSKFHFPIVLKAASIALKAENEEDRAQTAENDYVGRMERMVMFYNHSNLDEAEQIEYVEDFPGTY